MTEAQIALQNRKNTLVGKSSHKYGFTFFARQNFKKGEVVMLGFGKIIDHQTPHVSVQIAYNKHFLPKKWTGKYWNHSCDPNTYIKSRPDGFPSLIASRNIKKGEEINYGYWMTEFTWAKNADELKIRCKCGTKKCKGKIFSYLNLTEKEQKKLRNDEFCSKYLYTQP